MNRRKEDKMENLNQMFEKHPCFHYAMSLCASWAWGTSMVVGMEIVQTRGIIPFLIWAIANSLALPLFGFLSFRIPNFHEVIKSKPVALFQTGVECFCLWIQMNAIYQYLVKYGITGDLAGKAIAIAVAVFFLIILSKNGTMRNVFSDQPIWTICYVGIFAIMTIGFIGGYNTMDIPMLRSGSDISWALYTCIVLFSGPFMDLQGWVVAEKIKKENRMKAYNYAGILFAVYMGLVLFLSLLEFNRAMSVIMVLVICCVATSTINDAIVGMQRIAGRKVGIVLASAGIILWQIVIPMGVMGLWLTMGTCRIYVTLGCLVVALLKYFIPSLKKSTKGS